MTPDLAVLHTLRCIGHSSLGRVAEVAGLTGDATESQLLDLAVAGLVGRTPGPFAAWGITEAGKRADADRIGAELEAAGARGAVEAAYRRFLPLNAELLDLCSAWQIRPDRRSNDHRDPAYDARVLALLSDFDDRAAPLCAELTAALPRFGGYRPRLADAHRRAVGGEPELFTDHPTASYHAVWFQLHEDLLVTQGIPR